MADALLTGMHTAADRLCALLMQHAALRACTPQHIRDLLRSWLLSACVHRCAQARGLQGTSPPAHPTLAVLQRCYPDLWAHHGHTAPLPDVLHAPIQDVLATFLPPDITPSLLDLGRLCEALLEINVVEHGDALNGMCIEKGAERRLSGSHYTPPAVADALVNDALAPLLVNRQTPEQILALRICDPAMGAGAFLLAACRYLTAALLRTGMWEDGEIAARRCVATQCLYGVDQNALAVSLGRLSLWLAVGDPTLRPTALAPNLCTGDALVGLSTSQIQAFHWKPTSNGNGTVSTAHGDLCLAAFFAGTTPVKREQHRRRLATLQPHQSKAQAALHHIPVQPLHWPLAFPAVFAGADPGFDAVVGNPPFLNSINGMVSQNKSLLQYFRECYPLFSKGAYDICLLFMRRLDALLSTGGRYGMIMPTAVLSDMKPWQSWMHEHLRPDAFRLFSAQCFDTARIRTVGISGQRGQARQCRVMHHEDPEKTVRFERLWHPGIHNWYESTQPQAVFLDASRADIVPLSEQVTVRAGCVTGAAYRLRDMVVDAEQGEGPKLITTGALDRYQCHWGKNPIRFLRGDYMHPRWPGGDVDRSITRPRDAQRRPKILVGGLTAVIEAWLDVHGHSAGVVQTWVLYPAGDAECCWAMLGILNSATFSRLFMQKFGAAAMSGRQTTIKKSALQQMPVPRLQSTSADPAVIWQTDQPLSVLPNHVIQSGLARVAHALQLDADSELDAMGHWLAGQLYGRGAVECSADQAMWAERARLAVCTTPLAVLRRRPLIQQALQHPVAALPPVRLLEPLP